MAPSKVSDTTEAPPAYGDAIVAAETNGTNGDNDVDLSAAFSNLRLHSQSGAQDVSVHLCLAHLKFLHTLHALKEDVGYTDGLWGLWDSRAGAEADAVFDEIKKTGMMPDSKEVDKEMLALSKIREKRWAIYVARAVDRYETWWKSLRGDMLQEEEMSFLAGERYMDFTSRGDQMVWTSLPPLGKSGKLLCLRCKY